MEIVEKYVLEAWDRGKATPEIKAELIAKRWPEEMVEAVVDRLVKQRVEAQEGQAVAVSGPDLWTKPTWPETNSGWSTPEGEKNPSIKEKVAMSSVLNTGHKRKFSAMIEENSGIVGAQISPTVLPEERGEESTLDTSLAQMQVAANDVSVAVSAAAAAMEAVTTPDIMAQTQQLEPMMSSSGAVANGEESLPTAMTHLDEEMSDSKSQLPLEITAGSTSGQRMTRELVVARLQAREGTQKKLPQKLQENRNLRIEDEKIQLRSLILLGGLFLVIILALIWHFFVIK